VSKSTHFSGQPLYNQLLNFVKKDEVLRISREGGHERYVKKLDGYTHLVSLLFAVLQRYDSLRELVIGMLSEAHKLQHLGIDYCVRRSTISEANTRRSSDFFAEVYQSLYRRYRGDLADSRIEKAWFTKLYILDSTTISLFSNILKGAGRNPKRGKKKGGIKAHTVIRAEENIPCLVRYTSAATHDHHLLKHLDLPKGSFVAMDRAYVDYSQFERFTENEIFYVTKMKKGLLFIHQEDMYNSDTAHEGVIRDDVICFSKEELCHLSRRIEYWDIEKRKTVVLLTNNFELHSENIIEIYHRRWQIETLFKQLKQNFPLKYFYGDSVNAIETQIWVTLIANLLLTLVKNRVKRKWSFSNLVTMIRQMLMYYVDIYRFLENPEKEWLSILKEREKSSQELLLFA
jgi:hypothetical protein